MAEAVYYLVDLTTYTTLFEFATEESEKADLKVTWTKYPIEAGANVSDFGYVEPKEYEVEGYLTAYPMIGGENLPGLLAADKALETLAEAKQPVTLITYYWAVQIVLDSAERVSDGSAGNALKVKIKGHTVDIPGVRYTNVPAKRMKRAVKRRAAPKKAPAGASPKSTKTPSTDPYSPTNKAYWANIAAAL
jgi:hypothetical protein